MRDGPQGDQVALRVRDIAIFVLLLKKMQLEVIARAY
jgi:hypothetical protein